MGKKKTLIGLVGNTGTGKSLLDEERILPTNCMRACTAVVTKISYNHQAVRYRARIKFIPTDEWRSELSILYQDLLDAKGGLAKDHNNKDTEASMAYGKIKAVYPTKSDRELASSSIEELVQSLHDVLGEEKTFSDMNSEVFRKQLKVYVDSANRSSNGEVGTNLRVERVMEYWPLIKNVKIYTKAPVLLNGVVSVDLPGSQDANIARAAVAEKYKMKCSGL